jgi:hypothetical protein
MAVDEITSNGKASVVPSTFPKERGEESACVARRGSRNVYFRRMERFYVSWISHEEGVGNSGYSFLEGLNSGISLPTSAPPTAPNVVFRRAPRSPWSVMGRGVPTEERAT